MKYPGNRLQSTGGAIKLRYAPNSHNKGKSGSYRIIYFIVVKNNLYFLTLYPKNKKATLSNQENYEIYKTIKALRRFYHEQNE